MSDIIGRLLDEAEKAQRKGNLLLAEVCRDASDQLGLVMEERDRLREALLLMVSRTYSHVDGRDLLGELHPRNTLDIKRRVDGVETWFEADWLTELMTARNVARAALGEDRA